jgi:micrococcal nuclease
MRRAAIIFLLLTAPLLLPACDKDSGRPLAPRSDNASPAQTDPAVQELLRQLITFDSETEIQSALDNICAELPQDAEEVTVERVNDGDTITLTDGRLVRYTAVDSPEKDYNSGIAEPYFDEARSYNASLLEGKKILLVYDAEKEDRYHRTLAYVFAQPASSAGATVFVNAEMVRSGYSRAYRYPPNVRHCALMYALEEFAASRKRGMWQTVQYGFVGSAKSHKFHRTTCQYAEAMSPANRVEFKTRREALEAGYVPCNFCRP